MTQVVLMKLNRHSSSGCNQIFGKNQLRVINYIDVIISLKQKVTRFLSCNYGCFDVWIT